MSNKLIKTISLVSALLMLTSVLSACGGSSDTTSSANDTAAADTTAAETTTEDPGPKLDLPDGLDYNGYTFTFLTQTNYNNNFKLAVESDGDAINDAAYERNALVSEKLNVKFKSAEFDNPYETLKASVMAGEQVYDYVLPHAVTGVSAMVTEGLLFDWNKLGYVNFDNPWWNGRMTESLGIGGKLFYASGDIVMAWQGMQAVLFNKTYLDNMNLQKNLYDTVFDKEWTIDYMTKIIKGLSADVNGDGAMTEADRYGLLDNRNISYVYMYASGQRVTTPDKDGNPELTLNTEKMVNIVNKYYNLVYSGDTYLDVYNSTGYPTSTYRAMLIEGRSFLTTLDIGGLYQHLREIEFDFGIVPIPKYDEAQENYSIFCAAGIIGIPSNIPEPERTAAISEALAYYSYETIRPAFFDIVLENKAVRDENSYKIIRMLHESKTFDFGYNFNNTFNTILKNVVIDNKSTDFASAYAAKEQAFLTATKTILDAVAKLD